MNEKEEDSKTTRRQFLQIGTTTVLGASLATACGEPPHATLPSPNEAQRAHKKNGRSKVFTAVVSEYKEDAIESAIVEGWNNLGPDVKGKSVFLKPNLVDYREDLPLYTHPLVLAVLIRHLKKAGAREIKVGDGPAIIRDSEEIARLSGIADVCKQEDVAFIDLNIDDLDKVENPLQFTGINEFLLPRSVVKADLLISVPKLKTHHWALMTCSMKNLFGVIPGRKYGWPKNVLHIKGINTSIVDVVSTVKPHFAVVDGVIAMEGDGPLAGSAKEMHMMVLGDDVVAVDTVCAMCMQLPVENVLYLKLAGMVLGNANIGQIDVVGASIETLKKKFVLPPTYNDDGTPKNLNRLEKNADQGVT